ncbi:MAG: hypothetical protein ACE5DL_03480 [Nitrosopumilaceae archaeon]
MKGLYWLILGMCVWFIPTIIFQIIVTSGDSQLTAEEAVSDIPGEFVIILFAIALPIILKAVITIRKERKTERKDSKNKKKKSKKK